MDEAVLQEGDIKPSLQTISRGIIKTKPHQLHPEVEKRWRPSVPHLTRHIKRTIRRN